MTSENCSALLCPSIRVCRYIIKDLQLLLDKQDGGGYKGSHLKTAAPCYNLT
jgi:hypothetical protein